MSNKSVEFNTLEKEILIHEKIVRLSDYDKNELWELRPDKVGSIIVWSGKYKEHRRTLYYSSSNKELIYSGKSMKSDETILKLDCIHNIMNIAKVYANVNSVFIDWFKDYEYVGSHRKPIIGKYIVITILLDGGKNPRSTAIFQSNNRHICDRDMNDGDMMIVPDGYNKKIGVPEVDILSRRIDLTLFNH